MTFCEMWCPYCFSDGEYENVSCHFQGDSVGSPCNGKETLFKERPEQFKKDADMIEKHRQNVVRFFMDY